MILVDVTMPIIEKTYDFSLDENTSTAIIIDEIVEIIMQKEGYAFSQKSGDVLSFCLYDYNTQRALELNKSLSENNISNGSRLLLV